MSSMRFLIVLLALATLSGCGKLREPKDKGMVELKAIEQRWSDGVDLARSTPKLALAAQVAGLQAIKRDLDSVQVSECLKVAKVSLKEHMEAVIDSFREFLGGSKAAGQVMMFSAAASMNGYRQSRDACLK